MTELDQYFRSNNVRIPLHYPAVYERHLARFRNTDVHLLQMGTGDGERLELWKRYFGPDARIIGVDSEPGARALEDEQISVLVGDREDPAFLREIRDTLPRIDVLLDDGGHNVAQQIASFEALFLHLSTEGVYICETAQSCYWTQYGGGYGKPGTLMEISKGLIDDLHGYHKRGRNPDFQVTDFTRSLESIHFYDGMVVLEKAEIEPPQRVDKGEPQF